jgi:hypothetical protein
MVWKGTTKVGYGIRDNYVVAWYCEKPGNVDGEYKDNVEQDCVKDGVDVCFAERALAATNEKRSRHKGAAPLAHWTYASKAIQ